MAKLNNYNVYFVVKDWLSIEVKANNEQDARKQGKIIVENSPYRDKRIDIRDGSAEFAGITLIDVVNQI